MTDIGDPGGFQQAAERQDELLKQQVSVQNRADIQQMADDRSIEKGWSETTYRNHVRCLRILAKETESRDDYEDRIIDNSGQMMNLLLRDMQSERDWSNATRKDYVMALRILFKYHNKKAEVENIVTPDVENETVTKDSVVTWSDVQDMIDMSKNSRDKALIATLWESACRCTVLAGLQMKHYERKGNQYAILTVPDIEGSKNAEGNKKPLTRSRGYIDSWIIDHPLINDPSDPDPDIPLFCSLRARDRGDALYGRTPYKIIKRIAKRTENVNADNITAHGFRHGRATQMRESTTYNKEDIETMLDWTEDTQQHARYEWADDEEEANRILQRKGIEPVDAERKSDEEENCPRCNARVPATSQYCPRCSLRLEDEPPRWWTIYRKITDEDDFIRREYENEVPPATMSQLPPSFYDHVHNLMMGSLFPHSPATADGVPEMDDDDADYLMKNIAEIKEEQMDEYPIRSDN